MTDEQKKLAEGIANVVRRGMTAGADVEVRDYSLSASVTVLAHRLDPHPPLSPLQTLALSVLVAPDVENGSALIDALRECGVIDGSWEEVVRKDEREKVAEALESTAERFRGGSVKTLFTRLAFRVRTGHIHTQPPLPAVDSRGAG
jgi:hypothetical protein